MDDRMNGGEIMKTVSFREYVNEVLKTAQYKNGEGLDCVFAVAVALPA